MHLARLRDNLMTDVIIIELEIFALLAKINRTPQT